MNQPALPQSGKPPGTTTLEPPDALAAALSHQLAAQIGAMIQASDGFIGFEQYMQSVLYAPGLGYYSAGASKFGAAGDFVTAPELSPMFAQCLATVEKQVGDASASQILELGAGSGRLALDTLRSFHERGWALPDYTILEVSADLRERQRELLWREAPGLATKVRWIDALPHAFRGTIIANEVLDAIACRLAEYDQGLWYEIGVTLDAAGAFCYSRRDATDTFLEPLRPSLEHLPELASPYRLEFNPAAQALVASLAGCLSEGAVILVDYGFPAHEIYHPQRSSGTLMAHYRHHAHTDLFAWPGLQDITAHVDFTAMARAADDAGATLYGYTSQVRFLINAGLLDCISAALPGSDALRSARLAQGVQPLVSEAEMGELFKVLAFGRGLDEVLGFQTGDRLARL